MSGGQLVNSLGRNSKITERNTTDNYVLRQEFKVDIHFIRERSEIGKIVKFEDTVILFLAINVQSDQISCYSKQTEKQRIQRKSTISALTATL